MDSATDRDRSPIVAAVERDLKRWGPKIAQSALAASALDMARTLDDPSISATPRSMLHAQLRMTLETLQKQAPPEAANDQIDEVGAKRNERRAGLGA